MTRLRHLFWVLLFCVSTYFMLRKPDTTQQKEFRRQMFANERLLWKYPLKENVNWNEKKKITKRKEKKEKDRKESARLGLEPYTFELWRSRFLRSARYAVWLLSQVWHWPLFVNSSAFYTNTFFTAILYNYTTVRTYSHRPPLVFCVKMLNVVETRSCKEVMAH